MCITFAFVFCVRLCVHCALRSRCDTGSCSTICIAFIAAWIHVCVWNHSRPMTTWWAAVAVCVHLNILDSSAAQAESNAYVPESQCIHTRRRCVSACPTKCQTFLFGQLFYPCQTKGVLCSDSHLNWKFRAYQRSWLRPPQILLNFQMHGLAHSRSFSVMPFGWHSIICQNRASGTTDVFVFHGHSRLTQSCNYSEATMS